MQTDPKVRKRYFRLPDLLNSECYLSDPGRLNNTETNQESRCNKNKYYGSVESLEQKHYLIN